MKFPQNIIIQIMWNIIDDSFIFKDCINSIESWVLSWMLNGILEKVNFAYI
jgi:hypothetical protein